MSEIIRSNRFQALVALAVVSALYSYGWVGDIIWEGALLVLGGHIGIRTIDRFADKLGK